MVSVLVVFKRAELLPVYTLVATYILLPIEQLIMVMCVAPAAQLKEIRSHYPAYQRSKNQDTPNHPYQIAYPANRRTDHPPASSLQQVRPP